MGKDEGKKGERWYYSFLPNNMAGGSTSPLIPLFVTEGLAGTVAQVGLISAVSSMASVPSNILWGNLSDTAKKRRVFVLIGFGGMAMAMLMMGLATTFASYLFANFMLGLLSTAAAPVGTVLILESFKKEEWAKRLGDFSRVGGIGWVVGLMVGTIWLAFLNGGSDPSMPMRALFIVAALLAIMSMLLAYRWVPEPKEKIDRSTIGEHFNIPMMFERARYLPSRVFYILKLSSHNLKAKNFPSNLKLYYVVTLVLFTGFLTFYVGFPIFLRNYVGLSNSEVFIIYVASSLVSALTYSQAGKWVCKIGSKRIQMGAILGRIFLFPSFFLVTLIHLDTLQLVIVLCVLHGLLGFCWANISVSGSTTVSTTCYSGFRAESTGVYNAMVGLGTIAGALIGGYIAQFFGYLAMFLAASMFLIVGLMLLTRVNVEKAPSEKDGPECAHL